MAVLFLLCNIPGAVRWQRYGLLLVSAAIPWAGLQLVVTTAVVVIAHACLHRRIASNSIYVVLGGIIGFAAVLTLYQSQGVLNAFFVSTFIQASWLFSPHRVEPLMGILRASVPCTSGIFLLPGALAAGWLYYRGQLQAGRVFGLFFILAVSFPVVLQVACKYPGYYKWMSYAPLAVINAILLEKLVQNKRSAAIFIAGLCLIAIAIGLPARIAVGQHLSQGRHYDELDAYIATHLQPDDRAYGTYVAYYPLVKNTKRAYFWFYLNYVNNKTYISDEERAQWASQINVAVLTIFPHEHQGHKPHLDFLRKEFGGKWKAAAPSFSPEFTSFIYLASITPPYQVRIYRRSSP